MSDVPAWISATTSTVSTAGALYFGIQAVRQRSAADWPRLLRELCSKSDDELRQLVEDNPALAELVGAAWEAAARTASEEKQLLLARVAARGFDHAGAEDDLDVLPFLVKTIAAIEPAHVRLLVLIASPRWGEGQMAGSRVAGGVSVNEIERLWPNAKRMIPTLVRGLEREDLIHNVSGQAFLSTDPLWSLTDYGREFMGLLGSPVTGDATVTVSLQRLESRCGSRQILIVRNRGPAPAKDVMLDLPSWEDVSLCDPVPAFDLSPDEEHQVAVLGATFGHRPPYEITVSWDDQHGRHSWTGTLDMTVVQS